MKRTNNILALLLAMTVFISMTGLTANAATRATSITFSKTNDTTVRVGYAITRAAVTTPDSLTVTYKSSDTSIASVNEKGQVVSKKPGKVVITATTGGLNASYNVVVIAAVSTKVFDGFTVTVLDKATPAVTIMGRTTDRNVMCFLSADSNEVGTISYSDYNAIIRKYQKVVNLSGGGTYGAPPVDGKSWEAWFSDEYNKYRGLNARSREEAVESNTAETIEKYRQELVKLVNEEREKAGLSAYIINNKCMKYSQTRAEELVTLFSHTRPDGTNAGYEIIATGQASPEGAVASWMNSPGHKAAILNEGRVYVGAGVHITSTGGCFWQMYFERDPEVYANTKIMG